MTVRVAVCSVLDLFSNNDILDNEGNVIQLKLKIPEYQRPYVWQIKQLNKLILDITEHQKLPNKQLPYYLGCIILHSDLENMNIIDGQQRITTLALMNEVKKTCTHFPLIYNAIESQENIKNNLNWLRLNAVHFINELDFNSLQISIVITDSEDQAYQFFESQNTGGVRLNGTQIIKAHHLRTIGIKNESRIDHFAKLWEGLGDLSPVVDLIVRGRYWQNNFLFKEYPLYYQESMIRDCVVDELADKTGDGGDIKFGLTRYDSAKKDNENFNIVKNSYHLRQTLNSGENTIHYLAYFQTLYKNYLLNKNTNSELNNFNHFYQNLICKLDGCYYPKQLFDCSLLLYISQFGDFNLDVAAKKLFRVVYSRRVSNQVAVKEESISSFVKNEPVLDWIAASFTPKQLFTQLDCFVLEVDENGLDLDSNTVKKRFVKSVVEHFQLPLDETEYISKFGKALDSYIKKIKIKNE